MNLTTDNHRPAPYAGKRPRVVITGMGAITPAGHTVEEHWKNLVAGNSGVGPMTLCDTDGLSCKVAGEVKNYDPAKYLDFKEAKRMARFSQFAVSAARMAVADSGLDPAKEDAERVGVLIGNGNGGFPTTEEGCRTLIAKGGMRVTPLFMPMILANMAAAQISLAFGFKGYSSTIITACAASNEAMGEAVEILRRGSADVIITGGAEAGISQLGLAGFCVMRALSTSNEVPAKASRPFDAKRDGFVPGEGAGIFVMETLEHAANRGARILAEMVGFGVACDAHHITAPDPDGTGASNAMRWALADAGLKPTEIDYINAHGTSTPLNDAAETLAMKKVFGDYAYKVPISSTKSIIGHLLGASGGVEAIGCVKTINEGIIHPTINYEFPDPDCDLDYVPNVARKKDVKTVMSNSFGFGGINASLIFKKFED